MRGRGLSGTGYAAGGRARVLLAAACFVLSVIDGVFSVREAGRFSELNPLLRPLLLGSPLAFAAVKTALLALGLWTAARTQAARRATAILAAGVILYAIIDAYWIARAERELGWAGVLSGSAPRGASVQATDASSTTRVAPLR